MNRWFGYLLLTAGALLLLRARGSTASGLLSGLTGDSGMPGAGGQPGSGGGYTIGNIGSTFVQSNSLADAVKGLVGGIWDNEGQGYGGFLDIKTPDGSLRYKPPLQLNTLVPGTAGRLLADP